MFKNKHLEIPKNILICCTNTDQCTYAFSLISNFWFRICNYKNNNNKIMRLVKVVSVCAEKMGDCDAELK